jgi:hypothetical protein
VIKIDELGGVDGCLDLAVKTLVPVADVGHTEHRDGGGGEDYPRSAVGEAKRGHVAVTPEAIRLFLKCCQ